MPELVDSADRPVAVNLESRTQWAAEPLPRSPWRFPDPRTLDDHGLVGEGADFAPSTIVAAYCKGIFPWPHPENERLWFSPDPRAIIPLDGLRISRRLGRTIRSRKFHATVDGAFTDVMVSCAEARAEGTWITPGLMRAYQQLHLLGWAHSVEVWDTEGALVGGLYGVGVGAMFGAESMFHRVADASKVAMVALMQHARAIGIELIDIQVLTDHTQRMGAVEVPRDEYLALLNVAVERKARWREA